MKRYYTVKEERNVLYTMKRTQSSWIGHMLRRNCRPKSVTEGKIEGRIELTGRTRKKT